MVQMCTFSHKQSVMIGLNLKKKKKINNKIPNLNFNNLRIRPHRNICLYFLIKNIKRLTTVQWRVHGFTEATLSQVLTEASLFG